MLYDFKCPDCKRIEEDVYLSIHHTDEDHPICCGSPMRDHITKAPYVAWQDRQLLDGGFKAAHDGTVITSVKQNKDYMARHGLNNYHDMYPLILLDQSLDHDEFLQNSPCMVGYGQK